MRLHSYLRDHLPLFICNLLGMSFLSVFLLSAGNTGDTIAFILMVWLVTAAAASLIRYHCRKEYLDGLLRLAESLPEKYLLPEVMEQPSRADDMVFYRLLKISGKAMLEKINEIQREHLDYKEYIEQWVHEAKTPVTAIKLLCENEKAQDRKVSQPQPRFRLVLAELEKLNHYVEQVLYYARGEHTEKDYLVRETHMEAMIHQAVAENKQLLLGQKVQVIIKNCDVRVYTDEKWMVFILNQLIGNAVKYRKGNPCLEFDTQRRTDCVVLSVRDNGVGIAPEELPRIFEKGFTGTALRSESRSTGIGLYLCKRLCGRLGMGITADSGGEGGAVFYLSFYKNRLLEGVK